MISGFLTWLKFALCYNVRDLIHPQCYKSSGPSQKYSLGSQMPAPQRNLDRMEIILFTLVSIRFDNCILVPNGHLTACYTFHDSCINFKLYLQYLYLVIM